MGRTRSVPRMAVVDRPSPGRSWTLRSFTPLRPSGCASSSSVR
nr:MAG TPA: hypothetical protein [Caudoviricetes sp.]